MWLLCSGTFGAYVGPILPSLAFSLYFSHSVLSNCLISILLSKPSSLWGFGKDVGVREYSESLLAYFLFPLTVHFHISNLLTEHLIFIHCPINSHGKFIGYRTHAQIPLIVYQRGLSLNSFPEDMVICSTSGP